VTSDDRWTTAFAAALADPGDTLPFMPRPRSFRDQTIRQAVRLRRGGARLRLVLSNEFGRTPLVLDEVTAAAGDEPARRALLRGSRRWEIPPRQVAAGDPVALPAEAGGEVAVACYVAGEAGPAAFLHSAQRTGHAAAGNQAGCAPGEELDGSEPFASLYWIARVLTDAPAEGPVIVALGDSITRGDGTTVDGEQRYPDHLQARLRAAGMAGAVVLNAGLGGNRLLRARVGPPMTERFDRDVLGVAEASHVIIMGGVNDLGLPGLLGGRVPAAEQIVDGLFGLARRAARRGVQPVLGTLTPVLASRFDSFRAAGNEDVRQAVNRAILTQHEWPAADFAAAVADPGDPGRIAAAFDSGDGVHPGDAGARALAESIDLAAFRRVAAPVR
jgi:lysophospholipase L1-like esterase